MPKDNGSWSFGEDESGHIDYYSKRNSKYDRKSWQKSPSFFKKMMKKGRKSKEKQAMKKRSYENIPIFKKENDWLWN